jgi:nucleotide-binding universal stress UspA family protein
MRTVLVGFIDTGAGHAALEQGIVESRLRGARLVVLNSMVGGAHETDEEYAEIAAALERVEAHLAESDVEFEIHQYVQGHHPARDVCAAAANFDAELLVIGIRRRSASGKLLLGSNALEVLHDAPCPVLCVRATEA